jgi:hypothetical protein
LSSIGQPENAAVVGDAVVTGMVVDAAGAVVVVRADDGDDPVVAV